MSNIEINENNEDNELTSKQKLELLKKEVYQSIAKEFNISTETAKKLSSLKSETGLNNFDSLKKEVENNNKFDLNDKNNILSLTSENLQNLYNAISGAEKLTNKEFIDELEIIKIGTGDSLSKKLFPKLYEKAVKPENTKDQILGFCLGGVDTCSTTIKFLFDIGAGVVKTPNHTYLIISGKGEYKKLDKKTFILALAVSTISIGYIIYSFISK
ncbi:MAG: hypothetical protein WC850_00740 [Candidatus Gracilibacteria bacterium]